MDNITHSLIGAAIGQTGLKKLSGLGMATLIIAANIPDIDAACFLWLEGHEHLAFRRGITHGPIAMLLLPALLTAIMIWFDRWQKRRGSRPEARLAVRPLQLYLLALIGCLSHPAFDWLNNYGVRLLEPFSSRWFYGDTLFIIDVWLWAILIGGWFWSRRAEKDGGNWRRRGQMVATVVGLYVLANGVITGAAERGALATGPYPTVAIASPVPLLFWQRDVVSYDGAEDWRVNGRSVSECDVLDAVNRVSENSDLEAFKFWSRAPFAARSRDGSVLIRDARYAGALIGSRFTVALPDVPCNPIR
jgi:inner membrane protein